MFGMRQLFYLSAVLSIPTALAQSKGKWGAAVRLSLSASAGVIDPSTGNVIMWSSGTRDHYGGDGQYQQTYGAIYDIAAHSATEMVINGAHADLFCPGISVGFDGTIAVTGGSASRKTSISRSGQKGMFGPGGTLNTPRGYQSQVTLSNGKMFTIGGSWSGGEGNKNGEVYDAASGKWTSLDGCSVQPMLTADRRGVYRSDNHAWLFAWKDAAVLQAGPSAAMNWYYTAESGSQAPAGTRDNIDAMCGVAAMYDAVNGKILTAGGSSSYDDTDAIANANIVSLTSSQAPATVQSINPMKYARVFANAVVLPDGKVLINGGQSFGRLFTDANSTTIPEIWDPATAAFTPLADQHTGRTYHSWSLLLKDGTVLSGGGGLCASDTCTTASAEHFDAQVFTPPYLLAEDGVTPRQRPSLQRAPSAFAPGAKLTVKVDESNTACDFALVRLGSSTHTVNTDQRRVPLQVASRNGNSYSLATPSDQGVLVPGFWYLFALRDGVPSIAKIVQVTAAR